MRFSALRLAITGGPGEGKSTVLSFLQEAGVQTASADAFARELWDTSDFRLEVGALLGKRGEVSPEEARAALGSDSSFRRKLNRLAHPIILERMTQCGAFAFEVPLLIETCSHPLFERVWLVTSGPEVQRTRLLKRYGDLGTVQLLIAAQLPNEVKMAFADRVLRTNIPKARVRANVLEALAEDFGSIVHSDRVI